ncbi:MAG TPA: septum formation initiator family protein [Candidatus Saccharimonadales bacterium]|nr:septum formation initiator family protein [Candidatus Saccharimonadales bacterium]
MTFLMRRLIILFLVFELIVFFMLYCFGPKGLTKIIDLRKQQEQTQLDITHIQKEITALQHDIEINHTDFAKEKIAREKLLMKKDQEQVYFKTKVK